MMCFEEWSNCVLSNCGHYYTRPADKRHREIGNFRIRRNHGVDIAEMECRIDRIDRLRAGIRSDDSEYLFLLLQRDGESRVTHNGRQEILTPGDCLLMDSTRTAELSFEGRASAFTSVHLPRSLCLEGRGSVPATGRRIPRSHPLVASLLLLLAEEEKNDGQGTADYLFDFVSMLFRPDAGPARTFRDRHGRFRFACEMIECHLTEPDFSIERLVSLVNMSRRQLQRDFGENGTTFTHFLAERRVRLAADHLRRAAQMKRRPAIADLAFRAGFSDLSHFNRLFRHHYDMTPGDYYAARLSAAAHH